MHSRGQFFCRQIIDCSLFYLRGCYKKSSIIMFVTAIFVDNSYVIKSCIVICCITSMGVIKKFNYSVCNGHFFRRQFLCYQIMNCYLLYYPMGVIKSSIIMYITDIFSQTILMLSNHELLFVVLPHGCYKKFNYNVYNRYFFADNSYAIKS